MRRDNLARHFAVGLLFAVLLYIGAYAMIEHLRTRKGGWQVTFRSETNAAAIIVAQPRLGIRAATLSFPERRLDSTNSSTTIIFDRPVTNVPFGSVKYLDTTFLPGSVVLMVFGHEVQLLPRVLLVDRQEIKWQPEFTLRINDHGAVPRPRN